MDSELEEFRGLWEATTCGTSIHEGISIVEEEVPSLLKDKWETFKDALYSFEDSFEAWES